MPIEVSPEVSQHLTNAVITLLGALVTGLVAVIGAWANAFVTRKKREAEDYGAAKEKIRVMQKSLGIPESDMRDLRSPDVMHDAIRTLEKALAEKELNK